MGKVYKDASEVSELFGGFWQELLETTSFGEKLKEKSLSVKYVLKDYPEVSMYLDGDGLVIGSEANSRNAIVTLTLSGETVHKFWLKKIMVPVALAKGEIKTKGPFQKIMELMPLLKPGYALYPKYCEKYNIPV
ncbi:MAG: hypothetical protein ACOY46_06040 [Bacillota bacterium]